MMLDVCYELVLHAIIGFTYGMGAILRRIYVVPSRTRTGVLILATRGARGDFASGRTRSDVQPSVRAAAKPPRALGVRNSSKSGTPGREP